MATIKKLEEIAVYIESVNLVTLVFKTINLNPKLIKEYSLVDQIKRCSVSIPSNISEGFERGTNQEFIRFLNISKGSCSELKTQLLICKNLLLINDGEYTLLKNDCEKIIKKLSAFIGYLKLHNKNNRKTG